MVLRAYPGLRILPSIQRRTFSKSQTNAKATAGAASRISTSPRSEVPVPWCHQSQMEIVNPTLNQMLEDAIQRPNTPRRMVTAVSCLVIEVNRDEPTRYSKPHECRYDNPGADHDSTTATKPANIIVSTTQCSAGFVLTDSHVVMSISLLFGCLDLLSMVTGYRARALVAWPSTPRSIQFRAR
jgi:hypothetical protein